MTLFQRTGFWGIFLRAMRATVPLLLVMQYLEYRGMLAGPEGAVLDLLLGAGTPGDPGQIITVEIDDAAYGACFDASSPLNPRGVTDLVKNAQLAHPAMIGVDIITAAEKHAAAYRKLAQESRELKEKVVWIAAADDAKYRAASFPGWLANAEDAIVVRPSPVLGFESHEAAKEEIHWSVPVFPPDPDRSIRRFPREVELSANPDSSGMPAEEKAGWAKEIAERYCEEKGGCRMPGKSVHEIYVPFVRGPQRRLNVLDLFRCDKKTGEIKTGGRLWAEFQEFAQGKIVLIGGSFTAARDNYETPIGRIPGLLVNAYAVQSEIDGSGYRERRLQAELFDLLVGLVFSFVAWSLRRRGMRWMMTATFGLLVAALVFTHWEFGRGYVMSFTGVAIGLFLHQMYEVWHLNPKALGH